MPLKSVLPADSAAPSPKRSRRADDTKSISIDLSMSPVRLVAPALFNDVHMLSADELALSLDNSKNTITDTNSWNSSAHTSSSWNSPPVTPEVSHPCQDLLWNVSPNSWSTKTTTFSKSLEDKDIKKSTEGNNGWNAQPQPSVNLFESLDGLEDQYSSNSDKNSTTDTAFNSWNSSPISNASGSTNSWTSVSTSQIDKQKPAFFNTSSACDIINNSWTTPITKDIDTFTNSFSCDTSVSWNKPVDSQASNSWTSTTTMNQTAWNKPSIPNSSFIACNNICSTSWNATPDSSDQTSWDTKITKTTSWDTPSISKASWESKQTHQIVVKKPSPSFNLSEISKHDPKQIETNISFECSGWESDDNESVCSAQSVIFTGKGWGDPVPSESTPKHSESSVGWGRPSTPEPTEPSSDGWDDEPQEQEEEEIDDAVSQFWSTGWGVQKEEPQESIEDIKVKLACAMLEIARLNNLVQSQPEHVESQALVCQECEELKKTVEELKSTQAPIKEREVDVDSEYIRIANEMCTELQRVMEDVKIQTEISKRQLDEETKKVEMLRLENERLNKLLIEKDATIQQFKAVKAVSTVDTQTVSVVDTLFDVVQEKSDASIKWCPNSVDSNEESEDSEREETVEVVKTCMEVGTNTSDEIKTSCDDYSENYVNNDFMKLKTIERSSYKIEEFGISLLNETLNTSQVYNETSKVKPTKTPSHRKLQITTNFPERNDQMTSGVSSGTNTITSILSSAMSHETKHKKNVQKLNNRRDSDTISDESTNTAVNGFTKNRKGKDVKKNGFLKRFQEFEEMRVQNGGIGIVKAGWKLIRNSMKSKN